MSNNVTLFDFEIKCTERQAKILRFMVDDEAEESEEGNPCAYLNAYKDGVQQVYAEEYGRPGNLTDILAKWQIGVNYNDPVSFQWVGLCDNEVVDCGGVVVYKGTILWLYMPDIMVAETKKQWGVE